jgi:hypothetical protein
MKDVPPLRGVREGEVSPSYGDGGVMSTSTDAHDPSVGDYADTSPAKLGRKQMKEEAP